ncbi:pilus assembly PilX family protein [Lysobacter enzymogenes]|uniref:pilus assembly PilX family protein n=1 Tax=Lysobacter enzymogenes TaxID=69 RepID=UPI00099B3ABB|nr:PilX N-terminal domain-containing pilus assembly protein [Lysobacter enzymogenes]UZW62273.1 PilX N-terminal domain-containing pilus assembly protein [Lysobacter enzymogenes]
MPSIRLYRAPPRRQRGAALYVALIMLILLALLGLVGMQVTGMQERMSANYGRVSTAFQNAEALARQRETAIRTALYAGGGTFQADEELCSTTYDPSTWANAAASDSATHIRRIDKCVPASSLVVGGKKNEDTGNIYQVSALRGDLDANAGASAAIDTIFIP